MKIQKLNKKTSKISIIFNFTLKYISYTRDKDRKSKKIEQKT